jgi:hypothetical protein
VTRADAGLRIGVTELRRRPGNRMHVEREVPMGDVGVSTAATVDARFTVDAPHPILKAELYWAAPFAAETLKDPALLAKAVVDRKWSAVPATKNGDTYEAAIPAEAAQWFILVSDDRPMSVSSDMVNLNVK